MDALGHLVFQRTYARVKPDGTRETWEEMVGRCVRHTQSLGNGSVTDKELDEFRQRFNDRKFVVAGRTMKHAGSPHSMTRACCNFNCAGIDIRRPSDLAQAFWLQLNGCGVGTVVFPSPYLRHASRVKEVDIYRSGRDKDYRGCEQSQMEMRGGRLYIQFGDSAEGWASGIEMLFRWAPQATGVTLDLREIRGPGGLMGRYGWRSSGDAQLAYALTKIMEILRSGDGPLSRQETHDCYNLLGSALTNRRSAQIVLCSIDSPEWDSFSRCKMPGFDTTDSWWRSSSNNTTLFDTAEPPQETLDLWADRLLESAGGAETGILNAAEARRRAPWFEVFNPCSEIMLPFRGFCNLVDINVPGHDSFSDLLRTVTIAARHNYRQTCVSFDDGYLDSAWTDNNLALRLCGVGLTGLGDDKLSDSQFAKLRVQAWKAASDMASDMGLGLPAAVTTIKPSGSVSKLFGCSSGIHKPLAPYILRRVQLHDHDPLLGIMEGAGYTIEETSMGKVVVLPVKHEGYKWEAHPTRGLKMNWEPAIQQLERYKRVMRNYVDHNASITVSYDDHEMPAIKEWLRGNWKDVVALSFMRRIDPFEEKGFAYLPEEPVTPEEWNKHNERVRPVSWESLPADPEFALDHTTTECEGGACPVA